MSEVIPCKKCGRDPVFYKKLDDLSPEISLICVPCTIEENKVGEEERRGAAILKWNEQQTGEG